MSRNLRTSRGGKKNVAWSSPSESPGIIGRAVKKSENEKLDPDSAGIPAKPSSPDSTGKARYNTAAKCGFFFPIFGIVAAVDIRYRQLRQPHRQI